MVFYGTDISFRKKLIPVYENALDKDDEFLLQAAKVMNEISSFREVPKHMWYGDMDIIKKAFSYEENEKLYHELRFRLEMRLKYRVRTWSKN